MRSFVLTLAAVGALLGATPGCSKMSPEKACARATELLGDESPANCVADLTAMKEQRPEAYACNTKCLADSTSKEAVRTCANACPTGKDGGAKADGKAKKAAPVDGLTPELLKARLGKARQSLGFKDHELSAEHADAAGWSARLSMGASQPRGLARVYELTLLDVKDHAEGERLLEKMYRDGMSTRNGDKKALVVLCVLQRGADRAGPLEPCSGTDAKRDALVDALLR